MGGECRHLYRVEGTGVCRRTSQRDMRTAPARSSSAVMARPLLVFASIVVIALAACADDTKRPSARGTFAGGEHVAVVGVPPPVPIHPSTLEHLRVPAHLLADQVGAGTGASEMFTPTVPHLLRLRVEWACAPGGTMLAYLRDHLEDNLSGSLDNGFDGPIPVDHPPVLVEWFTTGACSWHVRALDE